MKLIKDILKRRQVEIDIIEIIDSQFNKLTVKHLLEAKDKKANKKLQQVISKLKVSLKNYIAKETLGIYGVSRVLKTVQDKLVDMGFDVDMAKGVVEDVMMR